MATGLDQRVGVTVIAATNRPDKIDPALPRTVCSLGLYSALFGFTCNASYNPRSIRTKVDAVAAAFHCTPHISTAETAAVV